ncbi:P2Y purinoceptor 8-like [Hoplias malabaricus]|uniref:P2Y purinoceptor 8-like n=1 Tax=Hoplias malabaricus TaxID=27720 RepID=UPI0034637B0D
MTNVANVTNVTVEQLASPLMTRVLPAIYTAVFIVSMPCNLLALILLCRLRNQATPTVIYSINLCIADLLFSATLPLQVDYHLRGNNWIFGKVTCGISTVTFYCNMYCSIFTACAIALERYCGVVIPLRTRHLRSSHKAILNCLLMWVLFLVFQMPYVLHDLTLSVQELNITTCFDVLPKEVFNGRKGLLYFISIYLLFFVLPMVILVACYCFVARALRQALDAGVKRSHKRTQALVILAAVCFITCYLPNMIVQLIHMFYRMQGKSIYATYKLTLGLNSLNCCFDPFVYYLASTELRQALWRLLRQWNCCPNAMREENAGSVLSEMPCSIRVNQNDDRSLIS